MKIRETLRMGRKAYLRGDWNRAKGLFIEVLESPSTDRERIIAQNYLRGIYLQESRHNKTCQQRDQERLGLERVGASEGLQKVGWWGFRFINRKPVSGMNGGGVLF